MTRNSDVHLTMIRIRGAAALIAMAVGLFFGFASSPSYGQMIAMSALFHAGSICLFAATLRRTKSRWLVGLGMAANFAFLIELAARYFFESRILEHAMAAG